MPQRAPIREEAMLFVLCVSPGLREYLARALTERRSLHSMCILPLCGSLFFNSRRIEHTHIIGADEARGRDICEQQGKL